MSDPEIAVRQLAEAVRRSLSLSELRLPGEFFPAHVAVALVDAVLHPRPWRRGAVAATGRYCRRFGLAQTRTDRWELPPVDGQESLSGLLHRFDELGSDAMANEVFRSPGDAPPVAIRRAQNVLRAARALHGIGVEVLQDIPARPPQAVEATLGTLRGSGSAVPRLLLMYTGDEDFVRGDSHVRRFVASAVGERTIPADRAEALVRAAAHELILAPRLLDFSIWEYGVSGAGVARPPAPISEK